MVERQVVARTDALDDETRELLQARLGLVFMVLAGVSFFYTFSQTTLGFFLPSSRGAPEVVMLITFGTGVCNALLAFRCRGLPRSLAELRAVDAGATLLTCWFVAVAMSQVKPAGEASVSLQLGLTYVLLARAVLLPSSGPRTLLIAVLALIPDGIAATAFRVWALDAVPSAGDWLRESYLVFRSLGVTAFLATLTSHVIYGLRRQVRESTRIGQYLLRSKLGEGGMGVVYLAIHALLRRETALKLLRPGRFDPNELARFEREVKLTAQLTHPNTVAIFDYGRTPDGVFYYAMEYLDGGDLEQLMQYAGPLPPGRVIWILEQICRALGEAHARGLIHRDIKPSNILLCERGLEGDVAKVVDFGLVKDLKGDVQLTRGETLAGTPLYLAPESITAPETIDARCDLYSLGAVAYFLLTGRPVFPGDSVVDVCAKHLHAIPDAPSQHESDVPVELDRVVLRCLAKAPSARFENTAALRDALLACPSERTWSSSSAADWWSAHGARFRAHSTRKQSARADAEQHPASLRIDFETRGQL